MNKISPETLKGGAWHEFQRKDSRSGGAGFWLSAEFLVPLAVVAVLLLLRAFTLAAVVAGVAVVLWVVRTTSSAGRRWVERATGWLAHQVGQLVAIILLAPAFYGVMTFARILRWFGGSDPLRLRSREAPTFWTPSDDESRRARHVQSMFCTERLMGSRMAVLPLVILAGFLVVAAEVGLRIYGFGQPLLYVQDGDVGYYPKPNQRVRHPGRVIVVNNHGMRSPDVAGQKAPGHIRILMLGDSTLAGTKVSNEELYSSLLQKRLNEKAGRPVVEVLNMGVNAWGPLHELAYVKKFGTFGADIAVICGPVYNAYRPRYTLDRLPFLPVSHPPRLALEQVFYELVWRYRESCLGRPDWMLGDRAETQARVGMDGYVELAGYLRQQGAEVLVEMLPPAPETLGRGPDAKAHELTGIMTPRLEKLGVPMNCAGDIFKDVRPIAKVYHDGVHFDRLGHQLYADYLATRLSTNSACLRQLFLHQ